MSYCHNCGERVTEKDTFCGGCGVGLKEFIKHVEHKIETSVKKSKTGMVFFIILVIIVGYILLDIWAVQQLQPALSLDSLLTGVSNFEGNLGITSASASTTIRIENPTFVPIIAGRVVYDAGYGSTKIADGKTGIVIVGPYSTQDLPANIKISYVNAGVSGLKALKNAVLGGNDKPNANFYADFGITKFQIGRYG